MDVFEGAYEGWAVVQCFGDTKIAGKVREVFQYGVTMLRIEIPAVDDQPERIVFKGGAAISDITPSTGEEVLAFVRSNLQVLAALAPEMLMKGPSGEPVCIDCEQKACVCDAENAGTAE